MGIYVDTEGTIQIKPELTEKELVYHGWSINGGLLLEDTTEIENRSNDELQEFVYFDGFADNVLQIKGGLTNIKFPLDLKRIRTYIA